MKITGQILKESRENQGVSLAEVAHATKISRRSLRAIEEADMNNLPPKTFLRGFVQSYAAYLKLDVDSVMSTFHEEMGTTRPESPINEEEETEAETQDGEVAAVLNQSTSWPLRILIVGAIVSLIIVIVIVLRVIEKYEKESEVPNLSGQVNQIERDSESDQPERIAPEAKPEPQPNATPQPARNTAPTPTLAPPPTSTPIPAPTPIPEPPPTPTPKPSPERTEESAASRPAATSHKVIIEALDKVQIQFSVDGKQTKTVQLAPEQTHTIKASSNMRVRISDGGAINILYNDRDRGVPGTLGQPIQLRFP